MILRRLVPTAGAVDLDAPDAGQKLDDLYRPPAGDWLRVNLIGSVDGSAIGADGTSASLTGGADRKILGSIRRIADVVLVGASSVRVEGYQLPRSAPLAVVTGSGDLSGHGFSDVPPDRHLMVLCPSSATQTVLKSLGGVPARIIEVPADAGVIVAADIVAALRDNGFASIVCEGGPSLAGGLLAAGLVDELCLSTSPVAGGPQLPLLGTAAPDPLAMRLEQLLADDSGYLFARWSVQR